MKLPSGITASSDYVADLWKPDWTQLGPKIATRCVTAIALCLGAGLLTGFPGAGAVAASGALGAGFGAFERLRGSSLLAMLAGTFGMGVSVFAGTLYGHSDAGYALLAATAGLACGLIVNLGSGLWYVGLQWAIAALVAGEFALDLDASLSRTALVVAGGLIQTLVVLLFRRFKPLAVGPIRNDVLTNRTGRKILLEATEMPSLIKEHLHPRNEAWAEAFRLAITLAGAAWLSRAVGLPHGYWAPMTALLVLKSDWTLTLGRGLARVSGTIVGVALATMIFIVFEPGSEALCALSLLAAWCCFTLTKVNYAIYSICITAFVVFQLGFIGLTGPEVALERGYATLLGFGCALIAHLIPVRFSAFSGKSD